MTKPKVTCRRKSICHPGYDNVNLIDNIGLLKLNNPGTNICFVNSVVQLVKPIFLSLLQSLLPSCSNTEVKKVSCALYDLYTISSNDSKSAKDLRTYVANGTGMLHFDQSSQQDAAEFLQYLDLILSTELRHEEEFRSFKKNYYVSERNKRLFMDTASGVCSNCLQLPSDVSQSYLFLKLSFHNHHDVVNIQSMIDNYFNQSKSSFKIKCVECCPHEKCIPSSICPLEGICERRDIKQSIDITWAPKFLIVQLLRWDVNGKKLNTKVTLDGEFKLSEHDVYEPIGVLCHNGLSPRNGHYITHMKMSCGQWILYDDEKVVMSSLVDAGGRGAYILLYKKKNAPFAQNFTDICIDNPVINNNIDIEDASAIVKQGETKCLKCCKIFKSIKLHLHWSDECKSFYDSNDYDFNVTGNICSDRELKGSGLLNECKSCKKVFQLLNIHIKKSALCLMYYEKEGILVKEDKESLRKRKSNEKRVMRTKRRFSNPELATRQETGYTQKVRQNKKAIDPEGAKAQEVGYTQGKREN